VAFAIAVMEWLSLAAHHSLVLIPFATSIVLVIGSPEAEAGATACPDWRTYRGDAARIAVLRLASLGSRPPRGGTGHAFDGCHRHVTSTGPN